MAATSRRSDKLFHSQLMLSVSERVGTIKKLRLITDALADKAIAGDVSAIRDIRDTLDGKPAQQIAIDGDLRVPVTFIMDLGDESTEIMRDVTQSVTHDEVAETMPNDVNLLEDKST